MEAGINQAHRAFIAKYRAHIPNMHVVTHPAKNVRSPNLHCFFLILVHHDKVSLNLLNSYGNDAKIETLKLLIMESDSFHVVFEFSSLAFISYFFVMLKNMICIVV